MMRRYRAFWPLVLLLPLLLTLTGCEACEGSTGPGLDPNFLSANGLIYLNSPGSHSLYAIDMKSGSTLYKFDVWVAVQGYVYLGCLVGLILLALVSRQQRRRE